MFRQFFRAKKHKKTQLEESKGTISHETQYFATGGEACFSFKELPKGINKATLTVRETSGKNKQGEDIYHIRRELFVPNEGVYDSSKIDVLREKGFIKSDSGYTLITEEKNTPDNSLENHEKPFFRQT